MMNQSTYQIFRGILLTLDVLEVLADQLLWLTTATCLWVYLASVF